MTRYALLLRGINVGGRNKVPMAELRTLLGELGYTEIRTHLQSGNAVLSSADPEDVLVARIEAALAEKFGFPVQCQARSAEQLHAVVRAHPLRELAIDGSKMLVLFLAEEPRAELAAEHDPVAFDPAHVVLGDRVIYQWCPAGFRDAPQLGPFVERRWKVSVTGRNWNTVSKLDGWLAS